MRIHTAAVTDALECLPATTRKEHTELITLEGNENATIKLNKIN